LRELVPETSASTNDFGLANLSIGEGIPVSGSFSSIDWGTDTKFLEVELDPLGGSSYIAMGTTQLLSVPYALYSENTANTDDADADPDNELNTSVNLNGTDLEVTDAGGTITTDLSSLQEDADADPGNELQNLTIDGNDLSISDGNTVVLPTGIPSGTSGQTLRHNGTNWEANNNLFHDGINVGIGLTNPVALLDVNGNINSNDNYLIDGNSVLSVEGMRNVMVGKGAGGNINASHVTLLGDSAGYNNQGSFNFFGGTNAGYTNNMGYHNTFLGSDAGYSNTDGLENAFIGTSSGISNTLGSFNTYLGCFAGLSNTSGMGNTFIGNSSGGNNITGRANTYLGTYSGSNNTGDSNIFIGYNAGYYETASSNKFIVANGYLEDNLLIYGDFKSGNIGLGSTNPTAKLQIAGRLRMVDGNEETGRVMISDSIGTAAWVDPTAIDDGDWNKNNNFVFNLNDSIGIGTAIPSRKLDVDFGDIIVQGPESFDLIGEQASLYLGTAHSYIRSEYGYGLTIGAYAASDAIAIKESSANVGIGTNLSDKSKIGLFTNNKDGSKSLPISHRLTLGHTMDTKLLRLVGPLGGFGHGARLNFGDADYVYIEEDEDDYMNIYAAQRISLTGGNVGIGTTSPNAKLDVAGRISISNTGGSVFIGEGTGQNDDFSDNFNIGIGDWALYSYIGSPWGDYNVAIGYLALYAFTGHQWWGGNNVAIGKMSMASSTTAENNVAIGENTLYNNIDGHYNVAIGSRALFNNIDGRKNYAVGDSALFSNTEGWFNVALGDRAGYNNQTGWGNVFIGSRAGYYETGSSKLYIDNIHTTTPLIWGDFYDERIVINGNETFNPNDRTFFVNGYAGGTTHWYMDSDKQLKKNISTISSSLDKVLQLRGVNYEWKETEYRATGAQMGFIAQEVQQVIPEVVDENNGHYTMQYSPITALLVEAVKEQQKMIEELRKEVDKLKSR